MSLESDLSKLNDFFLKTIDSLFIIIEKSNSETKLLQEENLQLQLQIEELNIKVSETSKIIRSENKQKQQKFTEEIDLKDKKIEELEKKNQELERNYLKSKRIIESIQQEKQKVLETKSENDKYDDANIQKLRNELDNYKKLNSQLNKKLEDQLQQNIKDRDDCEREIVALRNRISVLSSENQLVVQQNESLNMQELDLFKNIQREYFELIRKLRNENYTIVSNADLNRLSSQVEEVKIRVAQKLGEILPQIGPVIWSEIESSIQESDLTEKDGQQCLNAIKTSIDNIDKTINLIPSFIIPSLETTE